MSDNFYRFPTLMVPLNMVALLLTIAAFGTAWKSRPNSRIPLGISVVCIFACTLTYQIYFAGANAEFLTRSIELAQIENAIHTWATWHWLRTGLSIAALIFASWGLLVPKDRDDETDRDLVPTEINA
jgi:ABC-type multidrug transport system permease subunit